jgi:hypothetical protein
VKIEKCPCGAYGDDPHRADDENFEPTTGQVLAVLERQARSIAEKLGHEWTGIAPGPDAGEWVANCPRCFDWCHITPRTLGKVPVRGAMVTFACRVQAAPPTAKTCRYCGGPVSYKDVLCRHPMRMGPCAE